jgi:uncharacterized protein YbbC (DUF1343 family)
MKYNNVNGSDSEVEMSFGIIQTMFYHQFLPDIPATVICFADWYDEVSYDNSGLLQIKYNPNFSQKTQRF